jgi:hypothetical protein
VAKQEIAVTDQEQRPKRKVLRKLKRTQARHEKAERQVGKLRLRLERAEAKLAQHAQKLLLVQAKLHPSGGHAEPMGVDQNGGGSQLPAEDSMPLVAGASAPAADGDSRTTPPVAAASRRARPPRPRPKRRPAAGQTGK